MLKCHSRVGGNPVFEMLYGYPIKPGMTSYYFHRIAVTLFINSKRQHVQSFVIFEQSRHWNGN